MNSLVGMQATSLHTPTEDSLTDLMKSDGGDVGGLAAPQGMPATFDLLDETDDFNPEELLRSDLFNDSAEKLVNEEESFGNFGSPDGGFTTPIDSAVGLQPTINRNMGNGIAKREFVPMSLRRSDDTDFGAIKQLQQSHYPRQSPASFGNLHDVGERLYGNLNGASSRMQVQSPQTFHNNGMNNISNFHSGGVDTSNSESQSSFSAHDRATFPTYYGNNEMGDESGNGEFILDQRNVSMGNPYLNQANNEMVGNGGNREFVLNQSNSSMVNPYLNQVNNEMVDNIGNLEFVPDQRNSSMVDPYFNQGNNQMMNNGGSREFALDQTNASMVNPYLNQGNNQMMDNGGDREFALDQTSTSMVNPYLSHMNNGNRNGFYRSAPERTSSGNSTSYSSDITPALHASNSAILDHSQGSYRSNMSNSVALTEPMNMLGISQGSQIPNDPKHNNLVMPGSANRRSAPQRSRTYHPGSTMRSQGEPSLMMMQQQVQLQQEEDLRGGGDLALMQQHVQQMQELEQVDHHFHPNMDGAALPPMGLSQSMQLPPRSVSCGPGRRPDQGMNGPFLGHIPRERRLMNGRAGMMNNDLQAMQNELSGARTMGLGGNGNAPSVNDAMEKLCESMKRSAMSRTLVKQFSGAHNGVARTTSGNGVMMMGNRPGRSDDSSHRSAEGRPAVPVRRISNTKYHRQSRGVARHGSGHIVGVNSNLHNSSGSNLSLQIDGRNMGSL